MKIGMPIISSDCEYGPKEIIKDNFNGILLEIKIIKIRQKKFLNSIKIKNYFL